MFDFPDSPAVGQTYAPVNGPTWQWDGTVWKTSQSQGEMQINRIFIPGTQGAAVNYTYVKPANLRHLEFEGVAGGGSGAVAILTGASVWSHGSSGGGGSWGKKLFTAAALPASVAVTIGAPGAAATVSNGNDGAPTTFGSLITLPGGLHGFQGTSVAYTTFGTASASGYTALPTGCDVAKSGETSEPTCVSFNMGQATNATNAYMGRAGSSPWGAGAYSMWGTGMASVSGSGYGSGSTGCINAGSAAQKNSLAAQPGAVLLTEYLAVAPADVARPQRQTFVVGATGVNILVPATAKMARMVGMVWTGSGTPGVCLQVSLDGSTYLGTTGQYVVMGINSFGGSSTSPTKTATANQSYFQITNGADNLNVPHVFEADLVVAKPATTTYSIRSRGHSYNSAATNQQQELFWSGYVNDATASAGTQLAAFRIIPTSGAFNASGGSVTVDWIY